MKSILVLVLLSVVLVGFVGYADAYEGKIKFGESESVQSVKGDIIHYDGFIYRVEPTDSETVKIIITDINTEELILQDSVTVNQDSELFEDTDEIIWRFSYSVDTNNSLLQDHVRYLVTATYGDKSASDNLYFQLPPAEMNILIANSESFATQDETIKKEIPSWVKDIFRFYSDDEITDKELLNALQYLISVNILNP